MPRTTTCDRGAIILVRFVFADEKGAKRRPAVILSTEPYHVGRREVVVAAITSNIERLLVGDHRIAAWREAGLPLPSVVTGIVRTIKRDMIEGTLGALRYANSAPASARTVPPLAQQLAARRQLGKPDVVLVYLLPALPTGWASDGSDPNALSPPAPVIQADDANHDQ